MHRQLVSHFITAPRPIDWTGVCRLADKAYEVASLRNMSNPRYSHAVPRNTPVYHKARDPYDWQKSTAEIVIHIEGWVEKE